MKSPNRFHDYPESEVSRRQSRKAAADTERFDFKTGKAFSKAGGMKAKRTPPKISRRGAK